MNFWSSECPDCAASSRLIAESLATAPEKMKIRGVNTDKSENLDKARAKEAGFGIDYDSFLDPEYDLVHKLEVATTPALVISSPQCKTITITREYNLKKENSDSVRRLNSNRK